MIKRASAIRAFISGMERTARAAAAALVRERAPEILPHVVRDAAAGDTGEDRALDLERGLTKFLERRIPRWIDALEATDVERRDAVRRLIETDTIAGEEIPPVVVLGTVAIGYRVIESEIRMRASEYGYSAEELWAEVDLLRRAVLDAGRNLTDGGQVA